jgi:hypothetical protein
MLLFTWSVKLFNKNVFSEVTFRSLLERNVHLTIKHPVNLLKTELD